VSALERSLRRKAADRRGKRKGPLRIFGVALINQENFCLNSS
jgi:hypothetical protein